MSSPTPSPSVTGPSDRSERGVIDPIPLALGQGAIDRRAELRTGSWDDVPGDRRVVLVDDEGNAAVLRDGATARLVRVEDTGSDASKSLAGDLLLGIDAQGTTLIGRLFDPSEVDVPDDAQWSSLRSVGMRLPVDDRTLLAELLALTNWHRTHTHCPRCGEPTVVAGLGWWAYLSR